MDAGHPQSNKPLSPTNPFSGMSEDAQHSGTAYPATAGVYAGQASGADMTSAEARLANLQLNNSALSAAQQQVLSPGYGTSAPYSAGSHMTGASPPPASMQMVSPNSAASPGNSAPGGQPFLQLQGRSSGFAPGYGPQDPVAFNAVSPPVQPQLQPQPTRTSLDTPNQPSQPVLPPLIGPLLQFVNVELERALWHGSVLVLTNESLLPQGASRAQASPSYQAAGSSMHAGPTPAAVGSRAPVVEVWDDGVHGPGTGKPTVFPAKAIYTEPTYKYTFWRADITVALPQENEVDVVYQVFWDADETAIQSYSARPTYTFRLPAQASQWRMCVTSNTQFSRRVPDAARAALHGAGPVFRDLLAKHKANPFHVWIGTGGQFTGEGVWEDCEAVLRPFVLPGTDHSRRAHVQWTAEMAAAIERWYFLEYLRQWFGIGASHPLEQEGQRVFRQAAESIPYAFTPDSEIFPGFGSFDNQLQFTPVFNGLRHTGAKYFALFQAHTTPTLAHSEHGFLGEGYHAIRKLGPYTALLMLDTRTERQLAGIVDRHSYDVLFSELEARVPATATNLIVVTSNPVVFPRTKNFEALLRGASTTGLTSIISYAVGKQARNDWVARDRFGEPLAVTMLNDFWTSAVHRSERAFLVHSLQEFARRRSCRVTFASGHVNCIAASHLRTYTDSRFDPRKYPEQRGFVSDFRSMIQLTVSGVVQEPADSLTLRAYHFAGKSAPFDTFTEEKLYKTFNVDVNHLPPPNNNQKLLGRRSYGIIIEHDFDNDRQRPGLLSFFYVENEGCTGTAIPYIVNIPPLRYPLLPTAAPSRPGMRAGVTYRGYTANNDSAPATSSAAEPAAEPRAKEDPYEANPDPYSYDVPGYDSQPPQQSAPPPYAEALPGRTEGTYSSSYEHTAAWVQGSASHTTGSDAGGGPAHNSVSQAASYSQAPVSQAQASYSQAPVSQVSVSQASYSQAPPSQAPPPQVLPSQAPPPQVLPPQAPPSQAPYSQAPYSQAPYSQAPQGAHPSFHQQ
ncbi:hypothetical protein GGI25_003891 [Coemansia spiralis]|uniref:PhoD-like phosphatase domain-containing protein n=2 Tax=Coemansia TaxID=4863 RepID=A0A9W8G5I8_9FUNG|nr:hypothetical protein EDC05_003663 [Coemansia umbellata]KAJ2621125.1 hypothetical protein GGI26_004388 [Coemansia sp. RSA 1358]KAJ2675693.1 hypothetical protein GGI25_003891 [Coemansia spiralis]